MFPTAPAVKQEIAAWSPPQAVEKNICPIAVLFAGQEVPEERVILPSPVVA